MQGHKKGKDKMIHDICIYKYFFFSDFFFYYYFIFLQRQFTRMTKFIFDRVENIVAKKENAGYKHFLLFLQHFQKASFSGWFKLRTV